MPELLAIMFCLVESTSRTPICGTPPCSQRSSSHQRREVDLFTVEHRSKEIRSRPITRALYVGGLPLVARSCMRAFSTMQGAFVVAVATTDALTVAGADVVAFTASKLRGVDSIYDSMRTHSS
eukprot:6214241-Pleurochrysis_carterae.AAC.3